MKRLLKKLLTALLALCMLSAAIGAAAEAPADQEALARAFGDRALAIIAGLAPGRSLTLTADTPDGRHWQAEASAEGTAADPVWDFTLSTPEGTPFSLRWADGVCRAELPGRTLALDFSDPGALARSVLAALGVPADHPEGSMRLATQLLTDAVLPHTSFTGEGQDFHVRLSMTFAEAADGLSAFVDHALADPAQADALTGWLRFAEGIGITVPGTAEGFAENWPDMKAQLQARFEDPQNNSDLTAALDFVADPETGGFALTGDAAVLPKEGAGLYLSLDVSDSSRTLAVSAALGSVYEGTRSVNAAYTLRVSVDKAAGSFEGTLSEPYGTEYSLTGSWTGGYQTRGFQASFTRTARWSRPFVLTLDCLAADRTLTADAVISNGEDTWALNLRRAGNSLRATLRGDELSGELNADWQDGCVTGNLTLNDGMETLSGLLYWTRGSQSLSLSTLGETLLLDVLEDDAGQFVQARFRQLPAGRSTDDGVDLRVTPGKLRLVDNPRTLEAESVFQSETEHTLTIESTPRSKYYADDGPETEVYTLHTVLTEAPDTGRLDTVVEKDGETLLTLCLLSAPK